MSSKRGKQTQKGLLRKFAKSKDPRLHPSKQLLASLLLGYLDELWPFEVVKLYFGENPNRMRAEKEMEVEDSDLLNIEDKQYLETLYKNIRGGENASSDSASGEGRSS